jgi:hypothetical protein
LKGFFSTETLFIKTYCFYQILFYPKPTRYNPCTYSIHYEEPASYSVTSFPRYMMQTTTRFSTSFHYWLLMALLVVISPSQLWAQGPAWQWALPMNVYPGPNAPAPNGDVYVGGVIGQHANLNPLPLMTGSNSVRPFGFIARLNGTTQQWLWANRFDGQLYELTNTTDGGVTVVGEFNTTIVLGSFTLQSTGNHSLFVAHCSSTGQWQWATAAYVNGLLMSDPVTGYTTMATDIAPDGSVAVAGIYYNISALTFGTLPPLPNTGAWSYFVARLNGQTGQWQWATHAPITVYTDKPVKAIAFAPNGNVVLTGKLSGTGTFGTLPAMMNTGATKVLVACLNGQTGQWQWAVAPSHVGIGEGSALALTQTGDVVVAGQVIGPVTFGTLPTLPGTGGSMIVAGLSGSTGQWQWATQTGGTSTSASASALAITSTNEVMLMGTAIDTLRLGTLPPEWFIGPSTFVAKMAAQGGPWRWCSFSKPVVGLMSWSRDYTVPLYFSLTAADEPIIGGRMSGANFFGGPPFLISQNIPGTGPNYGYGTFIAKLATNPVVTSTSSRSLSTQTQLYPNPASTSFTIRLPKASTASTTARLLNSIGQIVRQQTAAAHTQKLVIDVRGLAPGIYTLLLPFETETISRRITIE